ncbi:SAM-dependent methyltransferase [Clostridium sp. AM29-11AC]|mgnify:FL=1|uniref:class I SAM-dependent methyltransferase n=1 Tax=Clostridium sp. AM29-11AC TaxID=2293028 RepID=UPI000E4A0790|nr:SAM-dependent methyltransferase [Clostridium sp. AM29-11AC]RHT59431.1 SAM-dependent methyltransferase [Clostridium sp. AM29-11AC]
MENENKLDEALLFFLNESLERIILSNPRTKDGFLKLVLRPLLLQGELKFQAEEFTEKQAFHKNMGAEEAAGYVKEQLLTLYRNGEIQSKLGSGTVLVSKKGTVTVKIKKNGKERAAGQKKAARICADGLSQEDISRLSLHNRKKNYVLPEGTPVPFLVDLGVMTKEGAVVKARYDKFRQINRFLEFVEDILPGLDPSRETRIIDFGCGKSYLTFAMYYYLKEIKGYPVRIVGLDLKKDVIALCSRLAQKFGFENLTFEHGNIADYEGTDQVDMVVTLHACDTATDYALAKAVRWGARVILSVPCCQHELNKQVKNDFLAPVLQYGLLKERMSALLTDGIRAGLLEEAGYRTQILEFIDMEHTPKNIMIRAVRQGKKKKQKGLEELIQGLHAEPTLQRLLREDGAI